MSEVLALKYRPRSFDELVGQESVTQVLTGALNGKRLSHAYLFSGLRGSGKTSTARIFAKCLVCDNSPTSTPCEKCENCRAANENRHIDIIEMDAASSRKIDDIRELIEHTKYKPTMAKYKIFIIDEVHMLTKEAFNALLKTLEEPPEYIKFILATTDPLKLPATILSRTQHFRFKRIGTDNIKHHLEYILDKEGIEYEEEALDILSRSGNGSLRDTLTLLDQAIIFSKNFIDAKSVADMLGIIDPQYLKTIFDTVLKGDKKNLLKIIKELESYETEVVIDEMIAYMKNSFFNEDVRFSTLLYDRFFRILSEAKNLLFLNADNGFVLSILFLKMVEATKVKEIDNIIKSFEKDIPLQMSKEGTKKPATVSTEKEKIITPDKKDEFSNKEIENDKFEALKKALYDRNYDTGKCFEDSVKFIKYENSILELESSADEKCKKTLRYASGVIKHLVKELFSLETKISMKKAPQKNSIEQERKEQTESTMQTPPSCVATPFKNEDNESTEENILDDPFIKKARELFNPKKIIVRRKV